MAQNEVQYVKMPLLALRGLHVFPGMLLTFDVERTASIGALNNAVRADQLIFLTAQKDLGADMPKADEIYPVGTVARVRQQLRQPRGNLCRVMVEGLYRAKAESVRCDPRAYSAYIERLDDRPERVSEDRKEALLRSCLSLFEEYIQYNSDMIGEQIINLLANPTPPMSPITSRRMCASASRIVRPCWRSAIPAAASPSSTACSRGSSTSSASRRS